MRKMRYEELEEAVEMWLKYPHDDHYLSLLLSGAATKPQVKDILRKKSVRKNPFRNHSFHGTYQDQNEGGKFKVEKERENDSDFKYENLEDSTDSVAYHCEMILEKIRRNPRRKRSFNGKYKDH